MFAQVVVAKRSPLRLPFFDYAVPKEMEAKIKIGQLVTVPFRSKNEFGVVKNISLETSTQKAALKPINTIVFSEPILNKGHLDFLEEVGVLYHTPLGFLLKNNLPPLQKRKLAKLIVKKTIDIHNKNELSKPTVYIYNNNQERVDYIQKQLTADGQVLIVVPEITDIRLLQKMFDDSVAIHSELSTKELFERMIAVWQGDKKIIIGTRRALFLPFDNLQTIIFDNDGNSSHKSWDMAPRFHTRDAALLLAKHTQAATHIISNTPTVETYYFAEKKIYNSASPLLPVLQKNFSIINARDERRAGNSSVISEELREALLNIKSGSVFLFLNRRGTVGYIACRDCGEVLVCPNCHRTLTYHQTSGTLECHYCHFKQAMVATCQKCRGTNIALYGAGTELVEKEVKKLLPHDKREIIRIDQDEKALGKINPDKEQIIIGTQLAWHRLDWTKLKLMAFIDADTPLFIPEYKSTENLWHLLCEALFRSPKEAIVFIQTSHSEHVVFQALYQPELFYRNELAQRKFFGYPPYNFLVKLFFGHPQKAVAAAEASRLYQTLLKLTNSEKTIKITPNLEMFPAFQKGNYWQVIIIKVPYGSYKRSIRNILQQVSGNWKVDLNPNTLLSF